MTQEHDKNNLLPALMILIALLVIIIIGDYLIVNNILNPGPTGPKNAETDIVTPGAVSTIYYLFSKLSSKIYMVRGIYLLLLFCMAYLNPSFKLGKDMTNKDKTLYILLALMLSVFVLMGYTKFAFYNLVIYPIIFFIQIFIVAKAVALLRKNFKDIDFFKSVSCEESANNFFFDFMTPKKGKMRIHVPEENIFIDGGPGSGKSHYIIKNIIFQSALRQYAAFIYDYEGDPTKEGNPILTQIAYSSIVSAKKAQTDPTQYKLKFAFVNFTDMTRTMRVNVLSARYFHEANAKLFINNLATNLMKNLEPSWKEKTDFWAGNAINFVSSIMYLLYKNHRHQGFNTIPHAISVCLCDSDAVFNWMSNDSEISKTMSAMLTAWKLGAAQQTAGAVSSAQLPIKLLYDKNIYWVLSADEFSLDISNKNEPYIFCVGNSPELKDSISPAISLILTTIMGQMNNPGKQKSVFCIDELPTVVIYGLDRFITTARKHFVSTVLSVQDFMQLVRDYGDKSANTIRTACGTLFQGKTGNNKTAEEIIRMLGDIKRTSVSYSEQSTGGMSTSESQQREKIIQERDIIGQKSGHFFVKVSNGEPPFAFTDIEGFHKETRYANHEIPPFSIKVDSGDYRMNEEIMENIVRANFEKIENDIATLLEPYMQKEEA